ncbi:alpha/beta fold hydrolase [Flavobacterium pallidum]|uniref:Alpha/beta hydrolase n=1 Tax=Flavobacterium pallidum TaxID=2172098 RepID=A0A2S1SHA7_9FLAO|nr:alpha/beta fold hydrolase [Flavobacterium pallidum]AWI25749.1 alpha/beta hydrolase [Flavobacterium pallidum]
MKKLQFLLLTKSIGGYINFLSFVNPGKAQRLAYRFFSEPRIGRLIDGKLPEILAVAERQTFSFEQNRFESFTWNGNENTILLVHGWESNAARWEKLLPYLQKTGSTIVAIDAPAHGLSTGKEFTVPRYAAFINIAAKHFKPSAIIGHSIGGVAAIYYQYKYQNPDLKRLITLGAPSELQVIVDQYIDLLSLNPKAKKLLYQYFVDHFDVRINEFSSHLFAKSIAVDGLIAHDIKDDSVSFAEAEKIAANWKNASFIRTNGLGHSMHDDGLYEKIADFLII